MKNKIGVIVDSFRKDSVEAGLRAAREVGADGLQIYSVAGEMSAARMDAPAREHFRALCAELGLEIAALCGDLGGHGFMIESEMAERVAASKAIVDLAVDLGTNVVTTHLGVIPADSSEAVYRTMQAACRALGPYAAARKVTFAIETGPEATETLREFLDSLGVEGIGVNYDPANLVMVGRHDPVAGVKILAPYIVHTHAKDGRNLMPCSESEVYGAFAENRYDQLVARLGGDPFLEVPLGEGQVNWTVYLGALREIGYQGYLTIEREVGDDPASDIAKAVVFLREQLRRMA